jgi:hypothetical protein
MTMTRPTTEQITHQGKLLSLCLPNSVDAKEFGAVGDGVADDTLALRAAFAYAMPLKKTVILSGHYKVTDYITNRIPQRTDNSELHMYCDGNVIITVPSTATQIKYLLGVQFSQPANISITGGSLEIACNQKVAEAMYFYNNYTAGTTGTVVIECPVKITDCHAPSGFSDNNASGLAVFGFWKRVELNDITVISVTRGASAGVCRGITLQVGKDGEGTIRRPYIQDVINGPGGADSDGIGLAGQFTGPTANLNYRYGRILVEDGTFVNCAGRAIKVQCSNVTIKNPYILRNKQVTQPNWIDIDFQHGNGILLNPTFEYRLDNGNPPFSSGAPVAFWGVLQDFEMQSLCANARLITEAKVDDFCYLFFYGGASKSSMTTISGLTAMSAGVLDGSAAFGSVAYIVGTSGEFDTMPGNVTVNVRDVSAPFDKAAVFIGYVDSAVAKTKIRPHVENVRNLLPAIASSNNSAIASIMFTAPFKTQELDSFTMRNCHNLNSAFYSFSGPLDSLDFSKLNVGNVFIVDLQALTAATNNPPWETAMGIGCMALVEVLASSNVYTGPRTIRVTVLGAPSGYRSKTFMTEDAGATWFEVGACAPRTKTADFTLGNLEDVVINNKTGSACVVTLPAASAHIGRKVLIKTIQAQAVDSASSNVVPLAGGAAGTAIVTGTAGKWAQLVSDGTNWVIMAAN